jgi:hypothetical protein
LKSRHWHAKWEIQSEFRHLCGESNLSFAFHCRYYLITRQVCAVLCNFFRIIRLVAPFKQLFSIWIFLSS